MLLFLQSFPEVVGMPRGDAEGTDRWAEDGGGGREEPGRNSLLLPTWEARRRRSHT